MADDTPLWFDQLATLARAQGFLTYAQVNEQLPLSMVDPEEIDGIVERLKGMGIKVVPDSPPAGA